MMKFHINGEQISTDFNYGTLIISGDENHGFRPFELMVASIVGCSGSVFQKVLEKQRTRIEDLSIHAEVRRNPQEANRIEWIRLNYTVKGNHLNIDRLYKNLELSRKNCSMIQSVKECIDIEERIKIIELSR